MTADQRKLNEAQILTFVCAHFIQLLQHVMKAREPLKLKMVCAVHNGFLAAIRKSLRMRTRKGDDIRTQAWHVAFGRRLHGICYAELLQQIRNMRVD